MIIDKHMNQTLSGIVRAVEKGVGEDCRHYDEESNTVTKNASPRVRVDNINTNLVNLFATSEAVETMIFKRACWQGVLVIDFVNKIIFLICTKSALDSVRKKKDRSNPHYIQTLVNNLNSDAISTYEQGSLFDFGLEDPYAFRKNTYEEDFIKILKRNPTFFQGYRCWLAVYKSANYMITNIDAMLLDKNGHTLECLSLLEYLKPDFSELTLESKDKPVKDGHDLVSIKPGVIGELSSEPDKKVEIYPREMGEDRKA